MVNYDFLWVVDMRHAGTETSEREGGVHKAMHAHETRNGAMGVGCWSHFFQTIEQTKVFYGGYTLVHNWYKLKEDSKYMPDYLTKRHSNT